MPTIIAVPQSPTQTTFHTTLGQIAETRSSPPPFKFRAVDATSPILEEEEGNGSSEDKNENRTQGDAPRHEVVSTLPRVEQSQLHTDRSTQAKTILTLDTSTMSVSSHENATNQPGAESAPLKTPKSPFQKRPTFTTRDSGIKRAVSGFFRRSRSQSTNNVSQSDTLPSNIPLENGIVMKVAKNHRMLPMRGMSARGSLITPRPNTSMVSPAHGGPSESCGMSQDSSSGDSHIDGPKNPTSTGFGFQSSISSHKISFAPLEKDAEYEVLPRSQRSTSADFEGTRMGADPQAQLPPRQVWGMAADTGVGLKSRRLSLSLPDDFTVDVVDLYSEFADQSKLVGRRGKSIGKGATAHVRLMNRKGGYVGEVYAVKEFRGKSSKENSKEYEKKVKSEYSIAKSAHHPNVVETVRLCTYNGRWNHVMEFCDQGDLFGLVAQKYLSRDDHLIDRLCLFKQLIQGLHYLHTHGIAHRDVKLENLLITRDSKLKITDFGVSEVFCGVHPGLRSAGGQCGKDMGEVRYCKPGMCGSPPYVAPEVVEKTGQYDPRPVDAWGAAVVMLCMAANGCLWQEAKPGNSPLYDDLIKGWSKWNAKHDSDEVNNGISETDYPYVAFFDRHINPPALRRILLTMLNPDPSKRASIVTVAKNRWLKNIECCQIDSYDDPPIPIDASQSVSAMKRFPKVVHHNHLPPSNHLGHKLVRLPGNSDLY